MKNYEKYKTAKELAVAFQSFCKEYPDCNGCPFEDKVGRETNICALLWLDTEAPNEEPLPCPFCGAEVKVGEIDNDNKEAVEFYIHCDGCHITTMDFATRGELLSMWNNRVARAVAKDIDDGR